MPRAGFSPAENDAPKPGVHIPMYLNRFKASPSLETLFVPVIRTMAIAVLATAAVASANAQTSSSSSDQAAQLPAASSFLPPKVPPAEPQYSSSADQNQPSTEASLNPAGGVNFANFLQYGGGQRRRYGAPRYRGNNTNADGSPKWTGYVGAGLAQPSGNPWKYDTPSWAFHV